MRMMLGQTGWHGRGEAARGEAAEEKRAGGLDAGLPGDGVEADSGRDRLDSEATLLVVTAGIVPESFLLPLLCLVIPCLSRGR